MAVTVDAVEYRRANKELVVHMACGVTAVYHNVSAVAHVSFAMSSNLTAYWQKYIDPVYLRNLVRGEDA